MLSRRMCPATRTPPDTGRESAGLGLLGRAGVFRRISFRFLHAIVTADGDLFAAYLDLDSAIVDVPIAHRAFGCIHKLSFPCRVCGSPQPSRRRLFPMEGSYQGGRDQTSRFLLISRKPRLLTTRRTSEGARRKGSVKWLWLEKPSSRASAVRSFAPSLSRSSEARNRRRVR